MRYTEFCGIFKSIISDHFHLADDQKSFSLNLVCFLCFRGMVLAILHEHSMYLCKQECKDIIVALAA